MSHVHEFFMHTYLSFLPFDICYWLVLFCMSLSLFLSDSLRNAPKASLLCPKTLFIPGHLLPLILFLFTFSFIMRRPVKTSRRTFLDVAFIQNARSSSRIFLILTYPLSFTVGVRNPFVISQSVVPPWSYRSFTPICTDLILPYLAFSLLFKVYV